MRTTSKRVFGQLTRLFGYRRYMPHREAVQPLPRPRSLDAFENMWVAVVDGKVAQAAESSHDLALKLHDMDHRRRGRAVIRFVRPTSDSYIVGAG